MDPLLLEAMREVDALTPACPPIAPPVRDWVTVEHERQLAVLGLTPRTDNATQADLNRIADAARARIRG